MKALSEHPRIAITIAVAIIILGPASVAAGTALATGTAAHTSDRALRAADHEVGGLRQQLHGTQLENAQLRAQVSTLTVQLARARHAQIRAASTTVKRRRAKR